ncbi:MAG: hypothetical protein ABI183_08315 [Polyangiaceae bacterium]
MGKLDDMRKLREKQFEEAQRAAAAAPKNGVAKNGIAHVAKPAAKPEADLDKDVPEFEDLSKPGKDSDNEPAAAKVADGEKARCSGCGKMKAVQNGLLVMHQKGMGKMCAGSRKAPA